MAYAEHEADRYDYKYVLDLMGMTDDGVREIIENEANQIAMPEPVHPWRLAKSPIDGVGYYLTVNAKPGAILAPVRVLNKRTPAGRYINHSKNPNATMRFGVDGNLYLIAIKNIPGCMGGGIGTEVTTNYAETLAMIAANQGESLCQQQ